MMVPSVLMLLAFFTPIGVTMMLLFIGSRYSWRRTFAAVYGLCVVLIIVLILLNYYLGPALLSKLYTPVAHLPMFILFYIIAPQRNWQMVFQFLSAILFCFLIQQGGALCYILFGRAVWGLALGYVLSAALILWVLVKYLLPLSRKNFQQVHRGWWLMCLLLAGHYFIMIYLIPEYSGLNAHATPIKMALTLFMTGTYVVFLLFIDSLSREMTSRQDALLSQMRLEALQGRMAAVKQAETTIRQERHDLRHRLQTIATLIEQKRDEEALAFIGVSEKRLDAQKMVQWCRQPVLDAMFASFFELARQQGTQVEADIRLEERLAVDEAELAIVLANAIENAINACEHLQEEARIIRCRVRSHPRLMFQIANPIEHPVSFGKDGLPLAEGEQHGFGSRSIAAFCKKYDATCHYEQQNGWFTLRVIC